MTQKIRRVNTIMIRDTYDSELEKDVVELLYRIKLGEEYLSACNVYRSVTGSQYISQLKIANDFFVIAFEALNTALMLEVAKLCDEQKDSYSIFRFFRRCQSDKFFSDIVENKREFGSVLAEFFAFFQKEEIRGIVDDIKFRRDKYYGHSDKNYFTEIDLLVQETSVTYEDIDMILKKFKYYCLRVYKLATRKDWIPNLHQGCLSPHRDCSDLLKLLKRC